MKILIITNLYPLPWEPNRATYNKQQFAYLAKSQDVFILVPIAWPAYFKHRKEIKNNQQNLRYIPYFYTPKIGRRLYSWFMFISLFLSSYRWMKALNVDCLLASWAYPDGVAASKIAKLLKVPFYLKVHGSDINIYSECASRSSQIISAANSSKGILSVSKALKKKMIVMGINKDLIKVIYNGIDSRLFYYEENKIAKGTNLLFIGNLKKAKGVVELIDSFINLQKDYADLTLTYAGDGDMMGVLRKKVEQNSLQKKVKLLGNVDHHQLPELVKKATFVVLPSYNEGVPNVILEAMACGTPVVATAVGGIPEVVSEGFSGVLIDSPTIADVQEGIVKALNHSWDKAAIAKSAEQFDWNRNVAEVEKMLNLM